MIELGFLRKNEHFVLNSREYYVCNLIRNSNGIVVCKDVITNELHWIHIDTYVEKIER